MFLLFFDVCKINVVIFTRSFQQKDKKTSKLPNKEDHVTYNFEAYKWYSSVYLLSSEYTLGTVLS